METGPTNKSGREASKAMATANQNGAPSTTQDAQR